MTSALLILISARDAHSRSGRIEKSFACLIFHRNTMENVKEKKRVKSDKNFKNFFFNWYLSQRIRKIYILKFNVFHFSSSLCYTFNVNLIKSRIYSNIFVVFKIYIEV